MARRLWPPKVIITPDANGNPNVVQLVPANNLQGSLKPLVSLPVSEVDVAVADINNDGILDIVATVKGLTASSELAGFLLYLRNKRN